MFRTLQGKLALALGALLLLVALLLVPLTLYISRIARQESNQMLNLDLATNAVSGKTLVRDGQLQLDAINRVMQSIERLKPSTQTYVLNPRGEILSASEPISRLARKQVDIRPLELFLHKQQVPIMGDDPRHATEQKVFAAARLIENGRDEGYLYIILDSSSYDSAVALIQRSYALQLRLAAIIVVLLCALVAGLVFFHHLTRRLTSLAQAMADFQGRDFRGAIALSSGSEKGDEIDRLTSIFSRMALRIEEQIEALREADAQRRELVSHASHDLRTPLAALRGYLETLLLKEGKIAPEEQRHYLQIATRHGERLSELVEELFELSKLDALQAQPSIEPFLLSELVHDVAQKYQLRAEQKGIKLQAQVGRDVPFVCADIGMIERVLENLIENALRHTPGGGSVVLALRAVEKGQVVRVQVIDTGTGIAPADLPRIFERFYRAPNADSNIKNNGENNGANNDNKSGAGLGLSIATRILELHGSELAVQSAPGKGATFTFDLRAYRE